jgi:peptide deformylase
MILEVVKYGHPALRKKGARVEKVTPEMQKLIADMFETMYSAKGVGLAAQQVGQALQLTVVDVRGATERPSTLELNGVGDTVAASEGCLSFPEIYADITRPGLADVKATNEKGAKLEFRAGGLLARAIQHELDHLNGVLFIDRMARADKDDLKPQLDELQAATKAALAKAQK